MGAAEALVLLIPRQPVAALPHTKTFPPAVTAALCPIEWLKGQPPQTTAVARRPSRWMSCSLRSHMVNSVSKPISASHADDLCGSFRLRPDLCPQRLPANNCADVLASSHAAKALLDHYGSSPLQTKHLYRLLSLDMRGLSLCRGPFRFFTKDSSHPRITR